MQYSKTMETTASASTIIPLIQDTPLDVARAALVTATAEHEMAVSYGSEADIAATWAEVRVAIRVCETLDADGC